MPDVDKLVAAIHQALVDLELVRSTASAAGAGAGRVEARAAQVGFRGIASGVWLIGERLERIQERQTQVVAQVQAVREAAHRVTADMNPDDVIATLTPVVQRIDEAAASARAILSEVHAATIQTRDSLKGGKPAKMLSLLSDVEQAVASAVARLWEAKERAEEVIAQARETGNFPAGMTAAG